MPAGKHNITIEKGATFRMILTWTDASDNAQDLTGSVIRMQVRTKHDSAVKKFDLSTTGGDITISSPESAGIFTIEIDDAATAAADFTSGVYDIEIEDTSGFVTRLLQGGVTVTDEVTR